MRGPADSALTGQTQAMVGLYLDDTRLTISATDEGGSRAAGPTAFIGMPRKRRPRRRPGARVWG